MSNTTFNKAFILINSLYFEDDETDFLSIIDSDPFFYHKIRCRCEAKTNDNYQEGIKLLLDFINLNPTHAFSYYLIACVYEILGDKVNALNYSNKAISLNSNNALFFNLRGNIYLDKSNFKKALNDFNKSIKIDSAFTIAYVNRGLYYLTTDRIDLAEIDYNYAIKQNSNNEYVYYLGCIIDLRHNNQQQALEKLNKAILINNKYSFAYRYRADLNEDLNHYEESIADYTKYIELTSGRTGIGYYYRGMTKFRFNDLRGAIDDFAKCMEITPSIECEFQLNSALNKIEIKNNKEKFLYDYYKSSPFTRKEYNSIFDKGLNIFGEKKFEFNDIEFETPINSSLN